MITIHGGMDGLKKSVYIFKRLDMILRNSALLELFPSLEVQHLIRQGSNHALIHLMCNTDDRIPIKLFRFHNFWTNHKKFKEVVKQHWVIDFIGVQC